MNELPENNKENYEENVLLTKNSLADLEENILKISQIISKALSNGNTIFGAGTEEVHQIVIICQLNLLVDSIKIENLFAQFLCLQIQH